MKKILSLLLTFIILTSAFGCDLDYLDNIDSSADESYISVEENCDSLIESTPQESKEEPSQPEPSESENFVSEAPSQETNVGVGEGNPSIKLSQIPDFSGNPYIVINDNVPTFSYSELTTQSYEHYSNLDYLGRCGVVIASIGKDLMPTENRGEIGMVKPTGWHTVKYDNVDGKYLYNRCHLIGWQLSGENANAKNLITGTRFFNVKGMLPFENMVADYVKETNNHVAYRVTPIFEGTNLLATGVQMEAYSIEDNGDGICFNVFCYNAQPDIIIEYSTGDSHYDNSVNEDSNQQNEDLHKITYILNTNLYKFHRPNCASVKEINDENKSETDKSREEVIKMGYEPCKRCNP